MELNGLIEARGTGADMTLTSGGQLFLDTVAYAEDVLTVEGGDDEFDSNIIMTQVFMIWIPESVSVEEL